MACCGQATRGGGGGTLLPHIRAHVQTRLQDIPRVFPGVAPPSSPRAPTNRRISCPAPTSGQPGANEQRLLFVARAGTNICCIMNRNGDIMCALAACASQAVAAPCGCAVRHAPGGHPRAVQCLSHSGPCACFLFCVSAHSTTPARSRRLSCRRWLRLSRLRPWPSVVAPRAHTLAPRPLCGTATSC